jgi:hypothetical protein
MTGSAGAWAAPSEGSAINRSKGYSTSYFKLTNVCAEVYTHFVADDRGSLLKITPGSNASFRIFNCSTGATRYDLVGRLTWTITAEGWAINECGASIPPGFSCSASYSSQTATESWDKAGSFRREIGAGEAFYFNDRTPGDITSVTSRATVVVNGIGLTATTKVTAP